MRIPRRRPVSREVLERAQHPAALSGDRCGHPGGCRGRVGAEHPAGQERAGVGRDVGDDAEVDAHADGLQQGRPAAEGILRGLAGKRAEELGPWGQVGRQPGHLAALLVDADQERKLRVGTEGIRHRPHDLRGFRHIIAHQDESTHAVHRGKGAQRRGIRSGLVQHQQAGDLLGQGHGREAPGGVFCNRIGRPAGPQRCRAGGAALLVRFRRGDAARKSESQQGQGGERRQAACAGRVSSAGDHRPRLACRPWEWRGAPPQIGCRR